MGELEKVTLGITTYGGAKFLRECLASIKKSVFDAKYSNVEVLVVDDGSPIDEKRMVEDVLRVQDVRGIFACSNLGNVARYNTVVENAEGDIIFLIDNDVIIPDRWFWSAYVFLTMNKNVGVASYLSLKIEDDAHAVQLLSKKKVIAEGSGRVPERATELAGYCFGFRKESWKKVGGFDADNFRFFMGDSDFCCRLAKEGLMSYRLLYPVVYHREHATYNTWFRGGMEQAQLDMSNFKKKWDATSKEMEKRLLAEIAPQEIQWYANYAVHTEWDEENKQPFKPPIVHLPAGAVEK